MRTRLMKHDHLSIFIAGSFRIFFHNVLKEFWDWTYKKIGGKNSWNKIVNWDMTDFGWNYTRKHVPVFQTFRLDYISIENHTYFLILIVWTLFEGNWVDLYVKLLSLRHVFRTESPQKIDILLLSLLQYLSTDILNISVFLLCS